MIFLGSALIGGKLGKHIYDASHTNLLKSAIHINSFVPREKFHILFVDGKITFKIKQT